jgi:hypothetical protein
MQTKNHQMGHSLINNDRDGAETPSTVLQQSLEVFGRCSSGGVIITTIRGDRKELTGLLI